MGLFGNSSPFDEQVAGATEKEDWSKILAVVDRAKESNQNAKDCLTSILTRLRNQEQNIVINAVTLLDACINNCGKPFLLNVASREFEGEFRKIVTKTKGEARQKLLTALRGWAGGEFSKDPQLSLIPALFKNLKQEGVTFPNESTVKKTEKTTASVARESSEDADLLKAIELSLKDSKEGGSPMNKSGGGSLYPTSSLTSSSLYPSTSAPAQSEGRKVRALYDFEAAEDGELTFKAGEIITILDEADQNWWKGRTHRGDGLFPSTFVTNELAVETEQSRTENKRSVQFNDEVSVKQIVKEEVEINEGKMDELLHLLHEADPTNPSTDPNEMRDLIDEVNAMGPLIDAELERVDARAAQLNQLCFDLQGSLNLYHSLMRDSVQQQMPAPTPNYLPKSMGYPYPSPLQGQLNGSGMMGGPPAGYQLPGAAPPSMPPHHYIPDPAVRPPNGLQYGSTGAPGPQPTPNYMGYPITILGAVGGPQPPPGYHDKPPLM